MKISTKARYGLRALVDLAIYSTGEQVPLVYIADRQQLSVHYLEQVFSMLKKSGLIKSIKGSQGGYMLIKKPEEITVGQVIRAIEGEILIVEEEDEKSQDSLLYKNLVACLQEKVWGPMTKSVCDTVDHITLEDLVKQQQQMNQQEALMYYI